MKPRWIIQDNLIHENDLKEVQDSCIALGIPYHETTVIPFSPELPEFPLDEDHENIYYGSTTFMYNLYRELRPKGLFFNENFSMENYIQKWGNHMLNANARVIPIGRFLVKEVDPDTHWFIRPDGDGKEFEGMVDKLDKLKENMYGVLKTHERVDENFKVLVGPAYNIGKEWRNYIVDGKIVTSSRYRNNFRLSKSGDDIPGSMLDFVNERLSEYSPHDVFAMDIAEVKDDGVDTYFIIECGCMNSVGFYKADIRKYVASISEYVSKL